MKKTICNRIPNIRMRFDDFMKDYLRGVTEQWLLVVPKANPAMLEMFRDRDASPLRQIVCCGGESAGKYLTGAVQVLRVTNDSKLQAWLKEFVPLLISFQNEDGYLGPWTKQCRLTNTNFEGESTWDTWGHYHIMLGLMLWHEETGDKDALECWRSEGMPEDTDEEAYFGLDIRRERRLMPVNNTGAIPGLPTSNIICSENVKSLAVIYSLRCAV